MLLKRSQKASPVCKFEIDSCSESSRQLRYAIRLFSHDLGGTVLLVDAIKWMEIYFTGLPHNCSILRHIIEESIKECAEVLSYDESAVEFYFGLPCPHNHSKHRIVAKHHPAYARPSAEHVEAICSIKKELPPIVLTQDKHVKWFESKQFVPVDMLHTIGKKVYN